MNIPSRKALPGGLELHNFYVPAGGDVPDPEQNDKFAHKLQFLTEMAAWVKANSRDLNLVTLAWLTPNKRGRVSPAPIDERQRHKCRKSFINSRLLRQGKPW